MDSLNTLETSLKRVKINLIKLRILITRINTRLKLRKREEDISEYEMKLQIES